MDDTRTGQHGRTAGKPGDIPARGWLDVLRRTWKSASEDNLSLLAAGVAFYGMLAIFPTIIAMVTIYGLVADPADVAEQAQPLTDLMPAEAATLLTDQLSSTASASSSGLTLGLVISLGGALWAASGGVSALITGLNAVYDETENRNFLKLRGLSLSLTLGAVVVVSIAVLLVAAFPAALGLLHLGVAARTGAEAARWLLLALLVAFGLSIFYRFGPNRARPRWQWVSWGAGLALVIWVLASIGFSIYVSNFGSYNKTYGTLAAVIILMLWLFLSAYVVLLGAELNAELERQTERDTTTGPERAMGEREARAADELGEGADLPEGRRPGRDRTGR